MNVPISPSKKTGIRGGIIILVGTNHVSLERMKL